MLYTLVYKDGGTHIIATGPRPEWFTFVTRVIPYLRNRFDNWLSYDYYRGQGVYVYRTPPEQLAKCLNDLGYEAEILNNIPEWFPKYG